MNPTLIQTPVQPLFVNSRNEPLKIYLHASVGSSYTQVLYHIVANGGVNVNAEDQAVCVLVQPGSPGAAEFIHFFRVVRGLQAFALRFDWVYACVRARKLLDDDIWAVGFTSNPPLGRANPPPSQNLLRVNAPHHLSSYEQVSRLPPAPAHVPRVAPNPAPGRIHSAPTSSAHLPPQFYAPMRSSSMPTQQPFPYHGPSTQTTTPAPPSACSHSGYTPRTISHWGVKALTGPSPATRPNEHLTSESAHPVSFPDAPKPRLPLFIHGIPFDAPIIPLTLPATGLARHVHAQSSEKQNSAQVNASITPHTEPSVAPPVTPVDPAQSVRTENPPLKRKRDSTEEYPSRWGKRNNSSTFSDSDAKYYAAIVALRASRGGPEPSTGNTNVIGPIVDPSSRENTSRTPTSASGFDSKGPSDEESAVSGRAAHQLESSYNPDSSPDPSSSPNSEKSYSEYDAQSEKESDTLH